VLEPLLTISGEGRRAPVGSLKSPAALGLVAGSLVLAGSTILFLFDPAESDFYPPCPFRFCTGLYCPGCGTTRALHALLHGNVVEAFGVNPLMVLMLPFLGYSLLSYAAFEVTGRPLPSLLTSPFWGWLVLGTILVYWALRNIPLYPFSLLAP
jgi:Protein of unknown function (DUF2752)